MKFFKRILPVCLLALVLALPVQASGLVTEAKLADPLTNEASGLDRRASVGDLQHPSKQEIAKKWNEVTYASSIYKTAPSITAPYKAGALTEDFLESGLTHLNYVRFVAGLPAVTLDATLNADAQHGAVVLAAIDELTHFPWQPGDMDDAFFNRGADATSSSNISARWGYSNLYDMLQSATSGCMDDNSSLNNLKTVGHRRWLLNPTLGKVGFGYAESAEKWSYIVTKVFDRSGAGCNYDFISWPVAGNHPTNLFEPYNPWSVTLNPNVFQYASADEVKITITRKADGKTWSLDGNTGEPVHSYYYIAPYLTVNTQWYGVPNCIIFHPGSNAVDSYEGVYQVKISGIYYSNGKAAELNYQVDFFDVDSVSAATPGDLNGDSQVNNEDVVFLLWHTLFPEENPISGNADFTGNGAVNNDDVVKLLWYTLFPEDNPL